MENRAEKSGIAAETHAKVRLEIYSDDKMMNHSLTISIIIIFFSPIYSIQPSMLRT